MNGRRLEGHPAAAQLPENPGTGNLPSEALARRPSNSAGGARNIDIEKLVLLNRRNNAFRNKRPPVPRIHGKFRCNRYNEVFFRNATNDIAAIAEG